MKRLLIAAILLWPALADAAPPTGWERSTWGSTGPGRGRTINVPADFQTMTRQHNPDYARAARDGQEIGRTPRRVPGMAIPFYVDGDTEIDVIGQLGMSIDGPNGSCDSSRWMLAVQVVIDGWVVFQATENHTHQQHYKDWSIVGSWMVGPGTHTIEIKAWAKPQVVDDDRCRPYYKTDRFSGVRVRIWE